MRRGHLLYSYHPANGMYISTQTNCKLHCQTNCHPMEYLKLETNCWKLKLVTGWATSSSALSAIKKQGKQDNEVVSIMVMGNILSLVF